MQLNDKQMNTVATHAALIRHQLDVADHAEKLREAATLAANELVRP